MNSMNDALKTMLIIFDISKEWKSIVQGAITSSIFVGAFIGALFTSYFLKMSCRKAIMIVDALLITGSVL